MQAIGVGDSLPVGMMLQRSQPLRQVAQRQNFAQGPDRRFFASVEVAPQEHLVTLCKQRINLTQQGAVMAIEQCRVAMRRGAGLVAQHVGPAGAQRDFHAFDGIVDLQPQPAIKVVERDDVVEVSTGSERLLTVDRRDLEAHPVAPKPVVVQVAEEVSGPRIVVDVHAATSQQGYLLVKGQGGFVRGLARRIHAQTPERKNPPKCACRPRSVEARRA